MAQGIFFSVQSGIQFRCMEVNVISYTPVQPSVRLFLKKFSLKPNSPPADFFKPNFGEIGQST
jgi:hypothetical protein